MAEQGIFVHAKGVVRQKVDIADVEFVGGETGDGFNRSFVGVKTLNQRHADGQLFSGGGQAF
ncbi:hypothetical protein D3C85_1457530 [compost metagenome]